MSHAGVSPFALNSLFFHLFFSASCDLSEDIAVSYSLWYPQCLAWQGVDNQIVSGMSDFKAFPGIITQDA